MSEESMRELQLEEMASLDAICEGTEELEWNRDVGEDLDRRICGVLRVSPEIEQMEIHTRNSLLPKLRATRPPKKREDGTVILTVEHLPTINLSFSLPPGYPEEQLPEYTISCPYLSPQQLTRVCSKLDELWEEMGHAEVLMEWLTFLKQECLETLGIGDRLPIRAPQPLAGAHTASTAATAATTITPTQAVETSTGEEEEEEQQEGEGDEKRGAREEGEHSATTLDHEAQSASNTASHNHPSSQPRADPRIKDIPLPPLALINELLAHDAREDHLAFEEGAHTCAICFSMKNGPDCMRFVVCRHVFCRECLSAYFTTQISEGQVRSMGCPDPECTNTPLPTEIQQLVPPRLFTKYDEKLLETTLAEMSDVVLCPRPACQQAVIVEDDSTLGRCMTCSYTFCTLCRMSYHGVNRCKIKDFKAVLNEYKAADAEKKARMEKKYGKRMLQRQLEEEASESYLQQETVPCPGCGASTSKIDGCNKMVCSKCHAYFCYLCRSKLPASDPYAHFQRDGPCASRLFEGTWDEPEEDEVGMMLVDLLLW